MLGIDYGQKGCGRNAGHPAPSAQIPGYAEAKIAVGFLSDNGVENSMHVGCYQQKAQLAINTLGQTHTAMIEHRGRVEAHREDDNRHRR